MPAHVKASLTGQDLTIPVRDGAFALGTWQGIYLCEHRDRGGPRRLVVDAGAGSPVAPGARRAFEAACAACARASAQWR